MSKIYHFLRLIRSLNLLVIVFTMYSVQYFISNYSPDVQLTDFRFMLLVFSVVIIAAAGNIINDYFDVKADRVNKPERLIIDKHIKRRWGIMFNWLFNFVGFSIAVYISIISGQYLIVLLASFSIVLLWLYSMLLKRRALIGNLAVAFLVALVPLYALLFYTADVHLIEGLEKEHKDYYVFIIVMGFAGCAFFINLLREITKDLADIIGDKKIDANTYPIKYGVLSTKVLIAIVAAVYIVFLIYLYLKLDHLLFSNAEALLGINASFPIVVGVLSAFVLTFLVGVLVTVFSKSTKSYKLGSNLYKIAMLAGVSLIFFL